MDKNEVIVIARRFLAENETEIADTLIGEEGTGIGDIFNVRRKPAAERAPEDAGKGDLWSVCFEINTREGVVMSPGEIIIRIEDSTGEARLVVMP